MNHRTGFIYCDISQIDKKFISDFLENNIPKEYPYSGPEINNINRNSTDSYITLFDGIIDNKDTRPEIYNFCDSKKDIVVNNFKFHLADGGKNGKYKILQIIFEKNSNIFDIQSECRKFNYSNEFDIQNNIKRNIAYLKKEYSIKLLRNCPLEELKFNGLYYDSN